MNWVAELVESALVEIVNDPKRLLDDNFNIFSAVAAELPTFAEFQRELQESTICSPDGQKHDIIKLVLAEARRPTSGSGNEQAQAITLELIKQQAARGLEKMRDPKLAIADKLADGANAYAKIADAHKRLQGISATNDGCENKFATPGDYVMRTFRGISVASLYSTHLALYSSVQRTALIAPFSL